jgi:hypothetical protein
MLKVGLHSSRILGDDSEQTDGHGHGGEDRVRFLDPARRPGAVDDAKADHIVEIVDERPARRSGRGEPGHRLMGDSAQVVNAPALFEELEQQAVVQRRNGNRIIGVLAKMNAGFGFDDAFGFVYPFERDHLIQRQVQIGAGRRCPGQRLVARFSVDRIGKDAVRGRMRRAAGSDLQFVFSPHI